MTCQRLRLRFGEARMSPWPVALLTLCTIAFLCSLSWRSPLAAEEKDSCVECHRDPGFLVTNKKLYDYYQQWTSSLHAQEEVTCVDCHGGDPGVSDKKGAHGGELSGSKRDSAVNFRNIPGTCGDCHEEILDGFRESAHFKHLVGKQQEEQGPNCVTCHGSISVTVLDVNTVEETCSQCHNPTSDSYPENPAKARDLLNRFLTIHRYYRYINVRGNAVETRQFFERVDSQLRDLSVTWHTFDLESIEEKTRAVLEALRTKREEVARIHKEKRRHRAAESPKE
jgi:hypothetical protein